MKSLLLFGAEGQVGWELQRALSPCWQVTPLTRRDVDLADAAAIRAAIRAAKPAVIVNAAAYTAVDKAESEAPLAQAINGAAPKVMAEEARACGAWLAHYSTDYVFDGAKAGAYVEDDATKPLSVYGSSKLAGEEAILAAGADHLIFRTSWVFGPHGGNFLRTILRLAAERAELRIIDDQHGAPTSAELIADVTAHALRAAQAGRLAGGLYHLAAAGETTWHGYASLIVAEARKLGAALKAESIAPIPTEQYPLPAPRPKNSRLDCTRLSGALDLALPDWQWHVRRTLREIVRP